MSLLNEMLNDLAKQKPLQKIYPRGVARARPSFTNHMRALVVGVLALMMVALLLLTHQSLTTKPAHLGGKMMVDGAFNAAVVAPKIYHAPASSSMLLSHITSIPPFQVKARHSEQITYDGDGLGHWQEEGIEISQGALNKVYQAQTLEEWHDKQLSKAMTALEEGDSERAIGLLQAVLIKVPQSIEAKEALATYYLGEGDKLHASEWINKGLAMHPHAIVFVTLKARLLMDAGQTEQALQLLLPHRPPMLKEPEFYAMLAATLEAEGRIREAGSLYKALLEVDGTNGQYWLGYALALEQDHETNQAIDAYQRASQAVDADPAVRAYAEHRLMILRG